MSTVIGKFDNSINAAIAKGLLEQNGITCQTNDDAFHQLWPTTAVQLSVEDIDAERATILLREHGYEL